MGAYSDKQLFAEIDAQDYGYRQATRSADISIRASLTEVLQISEAEADGILSNSIDERLTALRGIENNIKTAIELQERKLAIYGSEDSNVVAQGFIDDQTTYEQSRERGYSLGSDYSFYKGRNSDTWYAYSGLMEQYLDSKWVGRRLGWLGISSEPEFLEEVTNNIIEVMTAEEQNG